jgi:Fe-S-cluster containining protein
MTHDATTDELTALCGACGLCCNGSLFGRVPLAAEEVAAARRRRLRVLRDGRAFEQPCTALVRDLAAAGADDAHACAIYDERPNACAAFECRLYVRHRSEAGALETRLAAVRRVRELVALLDAEGISAADFDGDAGAIRARGAEGARLVEAFAELSRRLEEDFARAAEA